MGTTPKNARVLRAAAQGRCTEKAMSWLMLLLAGLLETVWAMGLKLSHGFSRPGLTVFTLVAMAASVLLLALAMRDLPVGTAYAIWTGIGAVGAVIGGIILFGDPVSFSRLACVALIVTGIAGLKLVS